jgi:tRNA pseudouridine65 synthase
VKNSAQVTEKERHPSGEPEAVGPLDVLYRDEHLVAVAKPSGLLVHRTTLDPREHVNAVRLLRDQLGQYVYPAHRLDRGTSGVLVFALDPAVLPTLAAAFESRDVEKTYLAVVRGWPAPEGTIDAALDRIVDPYDARPANPDGEPQAARTDYRTLATVELPVRVDRYPTSRYALVELRPHTGRRHQLRRHLRHVDHPLIGDTTYGQGRHNRLFRDRFGCHRLLLAAVELRLRHPVTGAELTLAAPLATDFIDVVDALGWTDAVPRAWRETPRRDAVG